MRAPRCLSLRTLLALLSLLLTLPMLVLSVAVGAMQVQAERRQIEAEAIGDARDLLQRADQLVASEAARLRRLARDWDSGAAPQALAAFHADTGLHLSLLDAEGTPRAETRPTPLPPPLQQAALALRRDGRLLSPLVEDADSGGHAVLLAEGVASGLLVLALPASALQALLANAPGRPFDGTRFPSLVDRKGRIVARWRDHARFIGQTTRGRETTAIGPQLEGVWRGTTLDGVPMLVGYARSATTGLSVGVSISEEALAEPAWRSALLLGGLAAMLLALAGGAGLLAARRIAGPVASLGAAATALAEGRPPPRLTTPVAEVNAVAEAMAEAAERRRLVENQRDLLVRELHHRVKNLLTAAQSLATLSARSARDPQDFARQFGERLRSLARTHTLLLEEPEGALSLRALLTQLLAPYRIEADRIAMTGPDVQLPTEAAVPLGMVLHELATNALKYGALSVAKGRVCIDWQLLPRDAAPLLVLDWTEQDGPPIAAPPAREGFGSQLLRRALSALPDGKTEIAWRSEGLAVRLTLGLRGATPGTPGPEATS
ncbi:HWE histidine kinase domain-containing protein [Falsiroseomonas sp.]|uniref:HWE histidine kinase domain-containing protein n=1 Tax=Falsiroseomonas sp. TaxID=2870721 RepID=UPI0034A28103